MGRSSKGGNGAGWMITVGGLLFLGAYVVKAHDRVTLVEGTLILVGYLLLAMLVALILYLGDRWG